MGSSWLLRYCWLFAILLVICDVVSYLRYCWLFAILLVICDIIGGVGYLRLIALSSNAIFFGINRLVLADDHSCLFFIFVSPLTDFCRTVLTQAASPGGRSIDPRSTPPSQHTPTRIKYMSGWPPDAMFRDCTWKGRHGVLRSNACVHPCRSSWFKSYLFCVLLPLRHTN